MECIQKNYDGFTLIEVLIGLLILLVGLIPILTYFANVTGVVYQSNLNSQALKLAVDTLEIIIARAKQDWSSLADIDNFGLADIYDPQKQKYDLAADFKITIIKSDFEFNPAGGQINSHELGEKIKVIVSWESISGIKKDISLETLITR